MTAACDPVAVGSSGAYLVRREGTWEVDEIAQGRYLYGLWDDGDSALLVVGYNGLVMRLTNPAWQVLDSGLTHWLQDVWTADCGRVVAVGKQGAVLISDGGGGWLNIAPALEGIDYTGVWGVSADDFFVVGDDGVILRYQAGRPWSVWWMQSGMNLAAVWGVDTGDVFAAGAGGTVVHFDGERWETMATHTEIALSDIHGRNAQDICAVGQEGTIIHFDGIVWRVLDSGTEDALYGVWCMADGESIAVGANGVALHNEGAPGAGSAWHTRNSDTFDTLYAMAGSGGTVWAGGANGAVVRYEGGVWSELDSGDRNRVTGMWASTCGNLHTVGFWGVILRYGN